MDKEEFKKQFKEQIQSTGGQLKQATDTYSYWKSKIGFLILALGGLLFLAYGGYRSYEKYKFQKEGLHAEAVVIDYRETTTQDSRTNKTHIQYIPILRFMSASGDSITTEYNLASSPPEFEKGENVTVYYMKDDPKTIEILGQMDVLMFGGLTVLGLIGMIIGVVRFTRM